jgi:hypothetical protein
LQKNEGHEPQAIITHYNYNSKDARGAVVEERKVLPACGLPLTLDRLVLPDRPILELLQTVKYRHTKIRIILVCWRPQ